MDILASHGVDDTRGRTCATRCHAFLSDCLSGWVLALREEHESAAHDGDEADWGMGYDAWASTKLACDAKLLSSEALLSRRMKFRARQVRGTGADSR
jgi:hypothetical protein